MAGPRQGRLDAEWRMTPKQARFIAEYLIDLNGRQAAIRSGYSPKTAHVQASHLLSNPNLAEEVERQRKAQLERLGLSAEEAIALNAEKARFDPGDLLDDDGNLLPIKSMSIAARRSLKKFKIVKKNLTAGDGLVDTVHEVEWCDGQRAIDLDYRRHSLTVEKVDLTVNDEAARFEALDAGRARAAAEAAERAKRKGDK